MSRASLTRFSVKGKRKSERSSNVTAPRDVPGAVRPLSQNGINVPHERMSTEHMELRHPEGDDFVLSDGFEGGELKFFQGSFVLIDSGRRVAFVQASGLKDEFLLCKNDIAHLNTGYLHSTQGLPPGSMSIMSSPLIVYSLWFAPFVHSPFSLFSTSPTP